MDDADRAQQTDERLQAAARRPRREGQQRTTTYAEKAAIHEFLKGVVTTAEGGCYYQGGWSDGQVAAKMTFDCTPSNVSYVRASIYGPVLKPVIAKPLTDADKIALLEAANITLSGRLLAIEAFVRKIAPDLGVDFDG